MMEIRLAKIISVIFHPVFMPAMILVFLLFSPKYEMVVVPDILKYSLTGLVFLTTILLPLSFIWLLKKLRYIDSLYLNNREERPYPLLTMAVFYYATYFIIKEVPVSPLFNIFILGSSLISGLTSIINIFRKISLHMTGAGSITGIFTGLAIHHGIDVMPELLIIIVLSGMIGWARLRTESHPPAEVYAGYLWGMTAMGTLMLIF